MKAPILVLTFAFLAGIRLTGQDNPILSGFIGKSSGEVVLLQWTIKSGQTCNGTFIERSSDTVGFQRIGEIPGICGSSESPVPYFFTDESPLVNQVNYYRLELGGQGYSRILAIPYFDYGNSSSLVIPNPAREYTTVYFENKLEKPYIILIYNLQGKCVHESTGNSGSIKLYVGNLPASTYLYKILIQNGNLLTGKIIVN